MRKPDFCLCENKGTDQISAFLFATWIVIVKLYLYPKFQASGFFYDCTGPFVSGLVGNPKDRFSQVAAH